MYLKLHHFLWVVKYLMLCIPSIFWCIKYSLLLSPKYFFFHLLFNCIVKLSYSSIDYSSHSSVNFNMWIHMGTTTVRILTHWIFRTMVPQSSYFIYEHVSIIRKHILSCLSIVTHTYTHPRSMPMTSDLCCYCSFVCLRMWYLWNHMACNLLRLGPLTQHSAFRARPGYCVCR